MGKEWWGKLSTDERDAYILKVSEGTAAALAALELNWGKAKIIKVGKTKMLVPFSEKLQVYYYFNKKVKKAASFKENT